MHSDQSTHKSSTINGCREKAFFVSDSTKLLKSHFLKLLLSKITTLPSLLLALFSSCSLSEYENGTNTCIMAMELDPPLSKASGTSINIDLFTFNDDELLQLDSYQQIRFTPSTKLTMRSRTGDKIVFVCANSQWEKYSWAEINSLPSLDNVCADLRKEDCEGFLMTGSRRIVAGENECEEIHIRPLVSEVYLRSICCDFSGKSYEGKEITDVSVYLTNVNSLCSITAEGEIKPSQILNAGGLDCDDIEEMKDKSLLMCGVEGNIGVQTRHVGISLFCYPNASEKDTPGTPFTRLVIEGKIEGETYWWPINVHRDDAGRRGVFRNCKYIYDITIKRKGSDSPEKAITSEEMDFELEVKAWEEKEDYPVYF